MKLFGKEVGFDKIKHFRICILIGFIGALVMFSIIVADQTHELVPLDYLYMMLAGFVLALIASLLKELVWDKLLKKGTPELLDVVFGLAGSLVGASMLCVFVVIMDYIS